MSTEMAEDDGKSSVELLSATDVAAKLNLNKKTFYRFAKREPSFPQPINFGIRLTRWRKDEVENWIKSSTRHKT